MSTKDWILLLFPILCNGVVVFLLQKSFERRQLAITEKYKYVSILQHKTDNALALFVKVLQATGNDSIQIDHLNQFIHSYCDILFFYQQNQILFKPLKQYMDEIMKIHNKLQNHHEKCSHEILNGNIDYESSFHRIYELLQTIQFHCVQHKI